MYSHRRSILSSEIKHDNPVTRSCSQYIRAPTLTAIAIDPLNEHPDREHLKSELLQLHSAEVPALFPYQIETVLNTVYRPSNMLISTPQYHDPSVSLVKARYNYHQNSNADIGKVVIIDLPTGSGKTLVSLVAAMQFAEKRSGDVMTSAPLLLREQVSDISFLNPIGDQAVPQLRNLILIFVPRHLTGQWQQSAQIINQLCNMSVLILVNPLAAALQEAEQSGRTVLCIYDDIAKISNAEIKLVPVVVVDEYVMRGEFNFALKVTGLFRLPIFGRLILVSADAGNTHKIMSGLRSHCIMKKFINCTNTSLSTLEQIHFLSSASALDSIQRRDIIGCMGLNVPIEIHTIRYIPSLTGMFFGSAFEISRRDGLQQFTSMGVDLQHCSSVQQIQRAIVARLQRPMLTMSSTNGQPVPINQPLLVQTDRKHRECLTVCLNALHNFFHNKDCCPICLDEIGEAAIIQPCFHSTCSRCMQQIIATRQRCPMCRSPIAGLVTSAVDNEAAEEDMDVEPSTVLRLHDTLQESLSASVNSTLSCLDAVIMVLKCLHHHANQELNQDTSFKFEPYRVLVAAPANIDFEQLKQNCQELQNFHHFCVHGTVSKRITNKAIENQLNEFKNSKHKFNVLFTSEGPKDLVTGLDFNNIDCLVTVGEGNDIQRLGRLTRANRSFKRGLVQYISVMPR